MGTPDTSLKKLKSELLECQVANQEYRLALLAAREKINGTSTFDFDVVTKIDELLDKYRDI